MLSSALHQPIARQRARFFVKHVVQYMVYLAIVSDGDPKNPTLQVKNETGPGRNRIISRKGIIEEVSTRGLSYAGRKLHKPGTTISVEGIKLKHRIEQGKGGYASSVKVGEDNK